MFQEMVYSPALGVTVCCALVLLVPVSLLGYRLRCEAYGSGLIVLWLIATLPAAAFNPGLVRSVIGALMVVPAGLALGAGISHHKRCAEPWHCLFSCHWLPGRQ